MIKVITYGTYDLLHEGHIRLLERAKALGDYLIVGVTSDDFDRTRGKINATQSLMERISAVQATGLADAIVVEEYEGQKIDDIRRFGVDVFTVGSDWIGKFDYLKEYCKVVYLPRTEGISSSDIRAKQRKSRIGLLGSGRILEKYKKECDYVNGLSVSWECENEEEYTSLLPECDAVYVQSHPQKHVKHIQMALEAGKHVLCESPIALTQNECKQLFDIATTNNLVLMDAIKTAYATAYNRLLLLVKSGKIGRVVSVDATSTSLMPPYTTVSELSSRWNSRCDWAPAPILAVLQLLGTEYETCKRTSFFADVTSNFDIFTKFDFKYKNAVASIKVGKGVKSEGDLVVSGTEGYVYVPSPWWKTEYFEVRFENPADNRRYYYQLAGEGIRSMLVAFSKKMLGENVVANVDRKCSEIISGMMDDRL